MSDLVTVRFTSVCDTPLSAKLNYDLFEVAQAAHEHFVAVLNQVQVHQALDLDTSVVKRTFLFYGELLNNAVAATMLLATHGNVIPLAITTRCAYEYVARAFYFAEHKDEAFQHLADLWNKGKRLHEGTEIVPSVQDHIERNAERFARDNPNFKRPPDHSLKQILQALYGQQRGGFYWRTFHHFYSAFVHGHWDAVPSILYFDGKGTSIRQPPDTTNAAVSNVVRFAFTMTTLMKRELRLVPTDTLALYHRFIVVRNRLGLRSRNPFPATLKMRGK